jgi:hypothetical protein
MVLLSKSLGVSTTDCGGISAATSCAYGGRNIIKFKTVSVFPSLARYKVFRTEFPVYRNPAWLSAPPRAPSQRSDILDRSPDTSRPRWSWPYSGIERAGYTAKHNQNNSLEAPPGATWALRRQRDASPPEPVRELLNSASQRRLGGWRSVTSLSAVRAACSGGRACVVVVEVEWWRSCACCPTIEALTRHDVHKNTTW